MSNSPVAETEPDNANAVPVSRRREKRIVERLVHAKVAEIDKSLREQIDKSAKELDVPAKMISQHFSVMTPLGETRPSMWWNGLVADRAEAWKSEYDGPGKHYLGWVAARIKAEDQYSDLSDEQKAHYTKIAAEKRAENKEVRTAGMTRKKVVEAAKAKLENLNRIAGFEFALFVARENVEDDFGPFYGSSEKAETFLQCHMKLPTRELVTMLDLWNVGGAANLTGVVKNRKEAVRQAVRLKLCALYCQVLESQGHDTSDFRHIKYSNYRTEIVIKFGVVLRGYPLTPDGNITHPSDYPGGIKGLGHADEQLAKGVWGFEALSDAVYKPWKLRFDEAVANDQPLPDPPYIPVPGSELKGAATSSSAGATSRKREGKSKSKGEVRKAAGVKKQKTGGEGAAKIKSREFITDSDDEGDQDEDYEAKDVVVPSKDDDDSTSQSPSSDDE
ncbi:hypothetical protein FRC09_005420 [Ceratobasidium sp. 395]|nr:hypothetical protein FRC09_005420 [Ceratobasidium sp. 395]